MSGPRVSVVIPAFNAERYIDEAICSVLDQSHSPAEIIVVDDGSKDRTRSVVEKYRGPVQYLFQENQGAGAARNLGVKLSQSLLLAFLDADDLWTPDKLALQLAALQEDPGCAMVFGHVQQFYSPEIPDEQQNREQQIKEPRPGYHVGTLLIHRDAFLRVGYFAPDWEVGEFVDWYSRACEQGLKSRMLPEVVMRRRLHTSNMGIRKRMHRADYARIVKASLDRRRRAASPPK